MPGGGDHSSVLLRFILPQGRIGPCVAYLNGRPPAVHSKALLRRSRLASHRHTCELLWQRPAVPAVDDATVQAWRLHTGFKPDMPLRRPDGTGQWLTAKPTRQEYSLSKEQMQHGFKQRLGIPLQPAGMKCQNETAQPL